jgi:4-phospho-D-threonate 3-dehydrogenase / 4-phospho-D-erythronate 3-dehydrogenase
MSAPSTKFHPNELPRIAITIGDAAGIGPEIVVKALADEQLALHCRPMIVGDRNMIQAAIESAKLDLDIASLEIFDVESLSENVEPGLVSAEAGRAAGRYIESAVGLWREGKVDAIATAPINKESLNAGGYDFPGHTEFLAVLTNTSDFAMSFFADKLRVVLLSTHLSLADAIKRVKRDALVKLVRFSSEQLSSLLHRPVKLAVAGLNPHASENGMFGSEEADEIIPAIEHCRDKLGIDVSGPYSPDTIFLRGHRGEFDGVIACYHDQATIAVKSLSFGSGVNVTLGLPLIRTSVDHGTAFDIAGKGIADAASMTAAIKLAAELAAIRLEAASA